MDFGGTKLAVALGDMDGSIQRCEELPPLVDGSPERAITCAIDVGRQLVAAQDDRLLGIGVATMGITLEDRVLLAPNVPGWERLAIPRMMREAFGDLPVRIENDVKAATYAELRWGSLRGIDTGIYVNLGTGIAAGLVVGGRVMRGAHGAAGEIGFNLRSIDEEHGAQEGRVPLEEGVGGGALAAQAAARFGQSPSELFEGYRQDAAVRQFVDSLLREIAFHLANLAIALDPSRIVVGAGLMRSGDIVLPVLRERIRRFTPFPPEIVPAHFLIDAALVGAMALALAPMPGT
jgi:glucokinase